MDAPPVQYATTNDGYSIAYTVCGTGKPLVFLPTRLSHVQLAWSDPLVAPWLEGLAGRFTLIRYDSRGQGLSSRELRETFVIGDYESDLDAVLEHVKVERPILMAHAVFGHVAVRYAIAHPGHVEALVLFPMASSMRALRFLDLAQQNWDLFLYQQVGGAALSPDERKDAISRLRQTTTQRDFLICTNASLNSSVSDALPRVAVPTLVLHPRDYPIYSLDESIKNAAAIPGARLALVDGASTLGDPEQGLRAFDDFVQTRLLSATARPSLVDASHDALSLRELDVLRLLAAGRSNQQIADELVISLNTVRRHVSNIFDKTGVTNRAQAAIYARDHGLA